LARARDDYGRAFFDRLFDPSAPPAVTVRELAEQYLELKREEGEAYKLGAESIDKKVENLALVREILGDDTLVRDINWDACRRFCSVLDKVPSNRTQIYRGAPLQDAIARAKADGRPGLAAITQAQYLAALKDLLDLAVNKELIRTNYAKDLRPLKVDDLAPEEKRIPFEIGQLVTFFNSPYYRNCGEEVEAPYRRADKDWRFWFPLLSLFSGMRPREIFQMHVQDLKQTEIGTWYFDIVATSDDDDEQAPQLKKTTKTKASRRQIPVHPELQLLGFLKFLEEQRKASNDPLLFRGITRGPYNDPAHYPLRDFRDKFLPQAIDLKPKQTAYSFRHTWRDAARRIKASQDFLKAVGAWSDGKSTADIYGSKHHPDLYANDLSKITFEGLDLSHLHVRSAA
jgi:integrase